MKSVAPISAKLRATHIFPIDFVCTTSPSSTSPSSSTLTMLDSIKHTVPIYDAGELIFAGLLEH